MRMCEPAIAISAPIEAARCTVTSTGRPHSRRATYIASPSAQSPPVVSIATRTGPAESISRKDRRSDIALVVIAVALVVTKRDDVAMADVEGEPAVDRV